MINSLFTKKNRSANEWYFPSGKDLEKTSASDAYVETFSDNKLTSLAREICQNSLDAVVDVTKPVKVSFEIIEVDTKSIPGYSELCETIIPRAHDAWPEEEKTIKLLNKMKKILNREKISILKISDNNTTGLEKKNWESLIEQAGSSVKSSDESGGSFGIGKAAPFAISDLRMVFYSTLTSSNIDQSIGVFKFVSYGIKNGETTQGTGYCGENLKTPFDYGAPFDPKKRQETGTDIYVFGFNVEDFPNWEKEIILSILDNFLISVSNNKLEVLVNGSEVKKNSINDHILKIKNDKKLTTLYNDLISYYEVLQDGHRKEIKMPGFKKLDIADGEATLILSNNFTNNRRVLMTRKAGMKIFDKKNISGIIQFSGVFCATGPKINKFLKELENPKHDKWSVDRSSDKKVADEFLKFIYSFIKDSVNKYYKEEIMDQVDAYGVKDFLPNDLNEIIKSDSEKVEKSLLGTKTKVKLKKIVQSNNN